MKKNIIIGCIISAIFIFLAVRGINFSDVIEKFPLGKLPLCHTH